MNGANCKAIEKRRCTVPINYVQLGALSELPLVERAIATLKAQMEHAEATWLRPEPIPEKPGKYILRLRPEFSEAEVRKTWSEWQAESFDCRNGARNWNANFRGRFRSMNNSEIDSLAESFAFDGAQSSDLAEEGEPFDAVGQLFENAKYDTAIGRSGAAEQLQAQTAHVERTAAEVLKAERKSPADSSPASSGDSDEHRLEKSDKAISFYLNFLQDRM